MANLPETPTFDAGVYQLELADPVQGGVNGVSNAPLRNLANRTRYLKQMVDSILAGTENLEGYARLESPAFTGSPTAPTQALGNNTTRIANTAFVQGTIGGVLTKSVAGTGSVTLTAVEAGNAILVLNGILTGNRDVIVPTSPTRSWIVRNDTTGASTLTVKTAAGTGVVVTQGTTAIVWTDGTNVYDGLTDFDSPVMTGNPVAPTADQFDNDTTLATTAFVQRALGSNAGVVVVSANRTMTAADAGKYLFSNANSLVYTLPNPAALALGTKFRIAQGNLTSGGSIAAPGGVTIGNITDGGTVSSVAMAQSTEYVLTVVTSTAYQLTRTSKGVEAPGSAPVYGCRAWVNFNGTVSTPTIRASGNVSSVTKHATGDYTVNFSTAMADENYCPILQSTGYNETTNQSRNVQIKGDQATGATGKTTNSLRIVRGLSGAVGAFEDSAEINVAILR